MWDGLVKELSDRRAVQTLYEDSHRLFQAARYVHSEMSEKVSQGRDNEARKWWRDRLEIVGELISKFDPLIGELERGRLALEHYSRENGALLDKIKEMEDFEDLLITKYLKQHGNKTSDS